MTRFERCSDQNNEGFALIAVLAFTFVVTMMVLPFTQQARTAAAVGSNRLDAHRLNWVAQGLADVFAGRVFSGPISSQFEYRKVRRCKAGDYRVRAVAIHHHGLIDINAASPALIALGFEAMGYDRRASDAMARTVFGSRSLSTGIGQSLGVELAGGLRKRPFLSVSELADLDVSSRLNTGVLRKFFTIRTRSGQLSQSLAHPSILAMASNAGSIIPWSSQNNERTSAVTVAVGIEEITSGFASEVGYVFAPAPTASGGHSFLEPVNSLLSSYEPQSDQGVPCADLFGAAVEETLRRGGP